MIDLHIHTNYSDGTWNLKTMLEEAQKNNIEIISITDHDSLEAYKELEKINIKDFYTGKIITGIEFSVVYSGICFDLLAYDFDYKILNKFVVDNYKGEKFNLKKEFEYIKNNCIKHNIKLGNIEYDINMGWPVDVIYNEIIKYEENKKYFNNEEWNNASVFFNSCSTKKDFPAYLDFSIIYPSADIVAKEVRNAGGKLFVAHVYRYNLENEIDFLDILKKNNIIDGVEVYHSSFSEEQTKVSFDYCIKNNLLMSGGSDCHGEKKKDRKIGKGYGNLNISKKIIDNWI